jgi:uncharacterized membrane protein
MVGLVIIAILILLAGPILAVIALARISSIEASLRNLRAELALKNGPVVQPAEVSEAPASVSKAWGTANAKGKEEESSPVDDELAVQKTEALSEPQDTVATEPEIVAAPLPRNDVESRLASRWFVWAGGAAVALGGLLFIKYAHDAGLVPPIVRVVLGLISAAALVFAGEWTRKRDVVFANGYLPAALSAAGLVIAFGVIYAAFALYGILSPAVCFPLLVAVALGALWLSRRQGPLIAALGILGAFAAPMLVPSEQPSVIGFFIYLAVVLCAALYELRDRPWWWLGFAALGGATVWSLLWINGFGISPLWPIGLFALLTGAAATFLPRGRGIFATEMGSLADPQTLQPPMTLAIAGMGAGALQLAALVIQSQHSGLALIFFAIAMIAITAFGWVRDGMVAAPLLAAFGSLVVLMAWPDVGFHEWAFDERGFWVTVPGLIEPPRFRTVLLLACAVFTVVGLAGVFLKTEKRPWAALAAGSAFLFLFGAWARADFTLSATVWTVIAVALAAALLVSADLAKESSTRSAEILAAGAAALLVFALDRMLDGVWLTIAIAVLATAYAYATSRITTQGMAAIASALASFAAARLFVGREFWGEPQGLLLGAHWVLYGYGIPAVLFWLASRWLTRDGFERWRMAFEGLAIGLAISLVSLELRVLIGGGITKDGMGLLELGAHAMAWLGAAYGLAYRQQVFSSLVSLWGSRILLGAACLAFLAALTVRNPVVTGDALEGNIVINSLWLAYLAPVPLLALMARKLDGLGLGKLRNGLGVFALVLLIAFITLQVKRWFQDSTLDISFLSQAESYATSLAWVVTGIAVFVGGLKLDRQAIRYGGFAILGLAILKVFAYDLFSLGGLWRIASIIGLGFCLIGVSWLYTRFVQSGKSKEQVAT